jgi:predicted flap endonuclease-1-like 5' DNA nuclease
MLCTCSARGSNTGPISNGSEIEESPGLKEVGQTSQAPEEQEEDEEDEEEDNRPVAAGGGGLHSSKVRLQRRRGTAGQETVDLQMVPGIGPRNMQKLVEKGIGRVSDLKQLYRDKVHK